MAQLITDHRSLITICGAGIAGLSAAYWLAARHGLPVTLVDERDPMSLTSDKSTEAYRNWWPGPGDAMVRLMNRSIDLLDELTRETGNAFNLNRRGYVYATADAGHVPRLLRGAEESSALGAGDLRVHRGAAGQPPYVPHHAEGLGGHAESGADLLLDPALIRHHFPYLAESTVAALHVRRAGWFSAYQLGMYLLEQAKRHGAKMINARVVGVEAVDGQVVGVRLNNGERLEADVFVNAAGPFVHQVGRVLGVDLPVFSELHLKLGFADHLGVLPRHAPLLIWDDPQMINWDEAERAALVEDLEMHWLLEQFPAGVHCRPDGPKGSPIVLMLWDYHKGAVEPVVPPPLDEFFPELVLRGLSTMLPGLKAYFGRAPRPSIDGGYYTKTRENRPLIGPLPVKGAYIIGAFSGYGLMAALAAGELLAAHIVGAELPGYAPAFSLERYSDPDYQKLLEQWGSIGQL
jgi:glycine/D-amino acid oxidase-like deaminating enzyme